MGRDIEQKKISLRKRYLCLRENLSDKEVFEKSQEIVEKILGLDEYKKSKSVLLYYPFKKEVDLLELVRISKDKRFYLPKIDFDRKELVVKKLGKKFIKNKYGIYEPYRTTYLKDFDLLDIIFIPGLVFDRQCFRIGFGGGYYDKFLKNVNSIKIGVCFEFQLVKNIPKNLYDVRLDYVVTEKSIIRKGDQI